MVDTSSVELFDKSLYKYRFQFSETFCRQHGNGSFSGLT